MRKTIAAAVAVVVLLTAGCQDQQARDQNAKLQAELDLLKTQKQGGGNDDLMKLLLADAKVAVAPGLGFGEYGEGYVRIALVENRERLRQAVRNIKRFMAKSAAA